MVTALIIAALVVAGIWLQRKHYKNLAETYIELYEDERSSRIDREVELSWAKSQLEDARQAYSRLIGQRAQGWAGAEVTRIY